MGRGGAASLTSLYNIGDEDTNPAYRGLASRLASMCVQTKGGGNLPFVLIISEGKASKGTQFLPHLKIRVSLLRFYEITDKFVRAYEQWKADEITAVEAMRQVGLKPNTFYRRVKEYEF